MWDKRKVLLAAIVFMALSCKVKTTERQKLLEVAPDVVDYMYDGCRDQAMEKFIHSDLLTQELSRSKEFQDANTQCPKMIPKGIKEHTAALWAYDKGGNFIDAFDRAVATKGGNVSTYEQFFNFKSLHFLLMDAITLLHPDRKECKTLHLISDTSVKNGSKVRFEGFAKVHLHYNPYKEDLNDLVMFNITSCFFANLGSNICKSDDDEVLLSPAEVFTVENVKPKTGPDDTEYTEIVLTRSELDRSHNCVMFSRSPAHVSAQWPVLVLVALSLFFLNC